MEKKRNISFAESSYYKNDFNEIIDECISLNKTDKIQAAHLDARLYTCAEFGIMTIDDAHELQLKIRANFDFTLTDFENIIT